MKCKSADGLLTLSRGGVEDGHENKNKDKDEFHVSFSSESLGTVAKVVSFA